MSLAFVFPGQGSQAVGMLSELAEQNTLVGTVFEEASDALGYDLWKIVSEGPADELNQTHITQPAILTASYATWKLLQDKGMAAPAIMAGHSLGEYSALVAAGAIGFADAVKLVAERGRLMQEAVPAGTGAMAAILGLDDDVVRDVCASAAGDEVASAVNFNSPGQVVIAGNKAAVERAIELAKEAGAKRALPLPVSVPSHCSLMQPAADKLAVVLADITINTPEIPVIHNCDVAAHSDADEIRKALTEQLFRPVRWVETIEAMGKQGVDQLIECGPGKVLAGLNKRIDKSMAVSSVNDQASVDAALA